MNTDDQRPPVWRRLSRALDRAEGRLSPEEETQFDAEVQADHELRADLDWANQLHQAAAAMPLVDPPALLRQKLRQQFRNRMSSGHHDGPGVVQLRAKLIFDSRTQELAGSLRGGADESTVVHHVWRTGVADVMLDIRSVSPTRVRLDGQVLLGHATSAPIFEARAIGPDGTEAFAAGDPLGRFRVDVTAPTGELHVSNGELTVLIPLGPVP